MADPGRNLDCTTSFADRVRFVIGPATMTPAALARPWSDTSKRNRPHTPNAPTKQEPSDTPANDCNMSVVFELGAHMWRYPGNTRHAMPETRAWNGIAATSATLMQPSESWAHNLRHPAAPLLATMYAPYA